MAQMTFSCNLALPCEAVVSGTKGSIRVHSPFWCTTKLDTPKASKDNTHTSIMSDFYQICSGLQ